jgi:hypothetical protein
LRNTPAFVGVGEACDLLIFGIFESAENQKIAAAAPPLHNQSSGIAQ